MLALATDSTLIRVDLKGEISSRSLEGTRVVSVARLGDELVAATEKSGVLIGSGDQWRVTGLKEETIWTVATDDNSSDCPRVFAGIEPAAIYRLDGESTWVELAALDKVAEHDDWHSPWGPADLCSIVVEPDRLIVGVEVGGVSISIDGGETWEARNEGLFEDVHRVVADGPDLYATTGGGVHRSRDGGMNWTWEAEGIDRGYTQGMALSSGYLIVASSSGPPPMWEAGGPEAAIFRAECGPALVFDLVTDEFEGNVSRQAIASMGSTVAAGTSEGELLVSEDTGATFKLVATGLPGINAVAFTGERSPGRPTTS